MSIAAGFGSKRGYHRSGVWLLGMAMATASLGCDSSSDAEGNTPPPIPSDDVEYIDFLVPHHQDAIRMADEEIERGASEEVVSMARDMKEVQLAEIETLERIRADLTGDPTSGADLESQEDPHMTSDLGRMEDMAGSELDRAFLWEMIPHHGGAVIVSHRALPNLEDAELRDLAETTISAQTREMNAMLDMLEQ